MSDFEQHVSESLGRIEAKVDALAGPQGRVTALEESQVRQMWLTIAIAPTLAFLHGIARKLGFDV